MKFNFKGFGRHKFNLLTFKMTFWNALHCFHQESGSNGDVFKDTHKEKLDSVQEFVKIKSWLLLILSTCLHNQLKFNYNSIKSAYV